MTASTNVDEGRIAQGSDPNSIVEAHPTEVGSPVSNEAYDVISALHAKLEGLEAYRKYAKDGGDRLWQDLARTELPAVEMLIARLEGLVRAGEFRLRSSGMTR